MRLGFFVEENIGLCTHRIVVGLECIFRVQLHELAEHAYPASW